MTQRHAAAIPAKPRRTTHRVLWERLGNRAKKGGGGFARTPTAFPFRVIGQARLTKDAGTVPSFLQWGWNPAFSDGAWQGAPVDR